MRRATSHVRQRRRHSIAGKPATVGWVAAAVAAAVLVEPGLAEPVTAQLRQVYAAARKQADQQVKAGQFEQAVATAEGFLKQYPDSGMSARGMAVLVEGVLARNLTDPAKRHAVYQRAYSEFEAATDYYCLGAVGLIREYVWGQGGVARDAKKAADLAQEVLDKLGDRLPRDYYLGYNLYMQRLIALRYAEGGEAALAFAKEAALACPSMLSNKDFLRAICDAAKTAKDAKLTVSAAKLFYVLCDFKEDDLAKATESVAAALTASQGPGAALQFAKSQEDPDTASPLKDVPLLELSDPEKLLAAAGEGNRNARVNVFLATGQTAEALAEATEQMRQSAGAAPQYLADALRNLARCFKAHDLNLLRANRFLEYHRTGEGENPLPVLEAELAQPPAR
ncbi:MAG: hypothetical protein GW880_18775 [Armatimonadetes bacterium]|nr:hypothetical protein [Armatimonadota bacterium]